MVPERRCSMFDRACFVLVGTKEPVGSSLEPPKTTQNINAFSAFRESVVGTDHC